MHTFETPNPVQLVLVSRSGHARVTAADTSETTVSLTAEDPDAEELIADAVVEQHGDAVVVRLPRGRGGLFRGRQPSVGIDVQVPAGSDLKAEHESADLHTTGELHDVVARLGSGDVTIDAVSGSAKVDTGSGDIRIARCEGNLKTSSGSGDIELGVVHGRTTTRSGSGDVSVEHAVGTVSSGSGSGDIVIRTSENGLTAKTGSGEVHVGDVRAGKVVATTASGGVEVAVAQGTAVWLDLNSVSGDVRNDLDAIDGPDETDRTLELRVKTASGDIAVSRA